MQEENNPAIMVVVSRIVREARALVAAQVMMAKRELSQNLRSARAGLILLVAAALFALVTIQALSIVAFLALVDLGLGVGTAAAIVFAIFLALTLALGLGGLRCLSAKAVLPKRTLNSLKSDIELFEEKHDEREAHGNA